MATSCLVLLRHLGPSPWRAARTQLSATRRGIRRVCSWRGRGPWCGGFCSIACRSRPACRLPLQGRLLAGAASLCLLGGSLLAGLLDGKHFLLVLPSVVPPPALLCRGGVVAIATPRT